MRYQSPFMVSDKKYILKIVIAGFILVAANNSYAQDSTKKKTIEITSTFKPVLREAVKINFNAAPPAVDSARTSLRYNIPSQNLSFAYQPAPLNPMALQVDSIISWQSSNYIKVGVGNAYIPFMQAALSFGNGKNSFYNVFANHFTSKGSLPFQKNNQTGVSLNGTIKTEKNVEWNGKLGFRSDDYFFYGFQPDTKVFSKDELRQQFQTFEGNISLRNIEPTTYGLNYYPNLKVSVFSGANNWRKATEANTVLNLPLQKTFGKSFGVNVGFTADLTNFRPGEKGDAINNNIYYFTPSLLLKTPNLYLETGVIPSWDNKVFKMLPNLVADISTNDKRFTLQLGWIGYFKKGSYERFAGINPWIMQPDTLLLNTRVSEKYAGFKGSVLNHFTYSVRMGFMQYKNLPLFVNDTVDGKTFLTRYSSAADAIQWHGEIGYTQGEKFSATAGLTWNKFVKVKDEGKAWGILPIELRSNVRWQIMKDFWLKGDLFAFEAPVHKTKDGYSRNDPGLDLGAGLEFKITRQFNLWLQMNNIFNNKYQRWNQYQVYGFNILGGVVFSFNQK